MKFIAVINKKHKLTSQMNGLAHTALGLSLKYLMTDIPFSDFNNNDVTISHLTDTPFIILTAKNSNQLHKFHKELVDKNLPQSAFFENMISGGTVQEQIQHVSSHLLNELDYIAVLTFGSDEELRELTKKFSLYRNPSV